MINVALFLVGLCLLLGCGGKTSSPTPEGSSREAGALADQFRFSDQSGLLPRKVIYENGEAAKENAILESLGGGVAMVDWDRDGRLDLCFPGGGTFADKSLVPQPTVLLRQSEVGRFEDVSLVSNASKARQYSHGCAAADFNQDGFPDLLITGYGGLQLLENSGDGTFTDVTEAANLIDRHWSSSAGWGDLNGDGHLDLYVAHYVNWSFENHPACRSYTGLPDVCPPLEFEGLDDEIFISQGDGGFLPQGKEWGLAQGGKGLGVLLADLDANRTLDVYVANDTTNNFLYVNSGTHLEERGVFNGVAVDDMGNANGSMGIALMDYNADRLPDLWVTNYEDEVFGLYRNEGDLLFVHSSAKSGLRNLGTVYVGFGCVSGDFDQDGDEDVAVANGHVIHHPKNAPLLQKALLVSNEAGHFVPGSETTGEYFSTPHLGRGLAEGDLDRDGDLDLVFTNTREAAAMLYNESELSGRALKVRLVGQKSNRDAIGATLLLETDQSRQVRFVIGGGSYLSTSDLAAHFGIPESQTVKSLTIHWPKGGETILDSQAWMEEANASRTEIVVIEPEGAEEARVVELPIP